MKNKLTYFVLAFCLIVNTATFAQASKWTVGLRFTPEYSYRSLFSDNSDYASFLIDIKNKDEIPQWGYSSGIITQYNFYKSFSAEMGVLFVNRGYTDNLNSYGDQIEGRNGFIGPDAAHLHYEYMQTPLYCLIKSAQADCTVALL